MDCKLSFLDKINTDYLIHHGIKGQKWGVRRYQNPDGSLTPAGKLRYGKHSEYIEKGSKFRRFDAYNETPDENNPLYVSTNDRDFNTYADEVRFLPSILKSDTPDKFSITTFETDKEMKIATGKKVADYILNKYGDTPYADTQKTYFQIYNEAKTGKDRMDLIYSIRGGIGSKDLETDDGNTKENREKYFKNYSEMYDYFSKNGYDAIIDPEDYNNILQYYDKPLIVLNPKNSIIEIGRQKVESILDFEEDIWLNNRNKPVLDSKTDLEKRYKSY